MTLRNFINKSVTQEQRWKHLIHAILFGNLVYIDVFFSLLSAIQLLI